MRTNRKNLVNLVVCFALATGMAHAASPHQGKTAAPATSSHKSKSKKGKSGKARKHGRKRGQQAMDPARVREIQSALIREKYLDGQPSGLWDQRSKEAMQRYQGDNGWQTKMIPDSRALIKLGLGPDRADLINPETAATTSYTPTPGGGSSQQR